VFAATFGAGVAALPLQEEHLARVRDRERVLATVTADSGSVTASQASLGAEVAVRFCPACARLLLHLVAELNVETLTADAAVLVELSHGSLISAQRIGYRKVRSDGWHCPEKMAN
jgi:hypothetical protein